MKSYLQLLYNGIIKENPSLILMLGMCPTLAVTTSASNGMGMGLSTMAVLVLANLLISLLRKIIPDAVRLPAFIVATDTAFFSFWTESSEYSVSSYGNPAQTGRLPLPSPHGALR